MYELVIVWEYTKENEDIERHTYETREKAQEIMNGYRKAFGHQMESMFIKEIRQ